MSANLIDRLLARPVPWLEAAGDQAGIVLASQVRLSRNLKGANFPSRCEPEERILVLEEVRDALSAAPTMTEGIGLDVAELRPMDRHILVERLLVSPQLIQQQMGSAVFVSVDQACSVMVNEEDHVTLQVFVPGLRLESAWSLADACESELAGQLEFAFRTEIGYLTSRLRNAGPGLRAGVVLHLPGLRLSRQLGGVMRAAESFGFKARALLSRKDGIAGNLVTVSKRPSLVEWDPDLLEALADFALNVTVLEKQARQLLLETDSQLLFDYVGRAYGAIRHAFRIEDFEALEFLSALRFGVDLGMIGNATYDQLNELWIAMRPAHLQHRLGRQMRRQHRESERARILREAICRRSF